ncbi:MAG: MFS transporter [Thermomicrobiales bacterium]
MSKGEARNQAEPNRNKRSIIEPIRNNRNFRLLWISNLFFFGGAWTQTLVLGWIVYTTTNSAFSLALFTAVRLAPLLLGPFGGLLSDRFDRVRLLMVACVWTLVAVSIVAAMATAGMTPFWALVLGGLAIGLAQSPSQPARSSLVFEMVGRENLSQANALNSMALNMTQVVGPALGGAMISAVGAPMTLWISTAWYAISLVALLPLRSLKRSRQVHSQSALRMLMGGFRIVLSNRLTRAVLMVTLAANVLIWPIYQSFMPVFAVDVLHLNAAGLGWLLTCSGVGGLTGALIIASLGDFEHKGGLFILGTATWAFLWFLFGLSHHSATSFILMIGIGLMSASFGVLQTTLLLMTTDSQVQGQALGMQELAIGIMPLSALAIGAIASQIGVGLTTQGSALLLVLTMVILAMQVPELLHYSGTESAQTQVSDAQSV